LHPSYCCTQWILPARCCCRLLLLLAQARSSKVQQARSRHCCWPHHCWQQACEAQRQPLPQARYHPQTSIHCRQALLLLLLLLLLLRLLLK
jgi:hypothetical protein